MSERTLALYYQLYYPPIISKCAVIRLILTACPSWAKAAIIANEHSSSCTLYRHHPSEYDQQRRMCSTWTISRCVHTWFSGDFQESIHENGSRHVSTATVNLAAALKEGKNPPIFLLHVLTPLLFHPAIQVSRALKVSLLWHRQLSLLHFKSLICAHKHISYIMVLSLNHSAHQLTGHTDQVCVSMCVCVVVCMPLSGKCIHTVHACSHVIMCVSVCTRMCSYLHLCVIMGCVHQHKEHKPPLSDRRHT